MAKRELPSPELLRQLLRYEPDTGAFYWRERLADAFLHLPHQKQEKTARYFNTRYAGRLAGSLNNNGYLAIQINGVQYGGHRIAFAITHGRWPIATIDHINRDRADNRLSNLREVPFNINCRNRRYVSTKRHVGVARDREKWRAYIKVDGVWLYLGRYADFDDAVRARVSAEERYGFI